MSSSNRSYNTEDQYSVPWLVIHKVPFSATEQRLLTFFQQFGLVQELKIMRMESHTLNVLVRMSTYLQTGAALADILSLRGKLEDVEIWSVADLGRKLLAEGCKLHDRCARNNLYVENVPAHWTSVELMEIFGRHGGVVQCRMFGNQGFRTSAALVRMHSVEAASTTLQALNGYFPVHRHGFGKPVGLVIRFADSPQEKAVRRSRQNKTNLMVQERAALK